MTMLSTIYGVTTFGYTVDEARLSYWLHTTTCLYEKKEKIPLPCLAPEP